MTGCQSARHRYVDATVINVASSTCRRLGTTKRPGMSSSERAIRGCVLRHTRQKHDIDWHGSKSPRVPPLTRGLEDGNMGTLAASNTDEAHQYWGAATAATLSGSVEISVANPLRRLAADREDTL
ncbi:hypothetical protein LIA77_05473 [Sarocladium implicatum]|nr:hypothetical protein LIA77_05473 [Sarocladium implicatum]